MVHIGVLKVLEEAQIPIAVIAGTSSGLDHGSGFLRGLSAAKMAEIGRRLAIQGLCPLDSGARRLLLE